MTLKAYKDSIETSSSTKLDANQTGFISEQLTMLSEAAISSDFKTLKAARFIPIKFENLFSFKTKRFVYLDHVGKAALKASCTDECPQADVGYREAEIKLETICSGFKMCFDDMEAAARTGQPLSQEKGRAVSRALAELMDEILAVGIPNTELKGFLNQNTVVSSSAVPNAGPWAALSPEDVLENLLAMTSQAYKASDESEALNPSNLILPTEAYCAATERSISATRPDFTIAQIFLAQNTTNITGLEHWARLDNASDALDNGGDPRAVVYRKDSDVLEGYVSNVREIEAERKGTAMLHNFEQRTAGVNIKRPYAINYFDLV